MMRLPRAQQSLPFGAADRARFVVSSVVEYALVRSKRKTITIEVRPNGKVVVRSPLRVSDREVRRFVDEKFDWIVAHRDAALRKIARRPKRRFVSGERVPYLGNDLVLRVQRESTGRRVPLVGRRGCDLLVHIDERLLEPDARRTAIADAVAQWYRKAAALYLTQRVEAWVPRVARRPSAVRIRSARGRWGSCNTQTGSINFSWQLMMVPPRLVDYVVAHELCHLWVPDHSQRFWTMLENIMPNYARRLDALRAIERVSGL